MLSVGHHPDLGLSPVLDGSYPPVTGLDLIERGVDPVDHALPPLPITLAGRKKNKGQQCLNVLHREPAYLGEDSGDQRIIGEARPSTNGPRKP